MAAARSLRHVVAVLPPVLFGIDFAKQIKTIMQLGQRILDLPYENVQKQMVRFDMFHWSTLNTVQRDGKDENSSMLSSLIELHTTQDGTVLNEKTIKSATAILYLGM